MKTLAELESKKSTIQGELDAINALIDDRKRGTVVLCTNNNYGKGCGHGFPISDLDYIQTHVYISPHGCSGGDYWVCGEGNFNCLMCGHRNRLCDRPDIDNLKYLFRSVVNEHKN